MGEGGLRRPGGWCLLGLLAACESTRPEAARSTARPGYDQAMSKVVATLTADSAHRVALTADSAFVYTARHEVVFRQVAITLFRATGEPAATVSARGGAFHVAEARLDLRDGVQLITTAGETLRTPHLAYDLRSLVVASDSAFTFETRAGTLRGARFTSDLSLRGASAAGRAAP